MNAYDQEILNDQLEGLRARIADGWTVTLLEEAPLHVPGCDDTANRFFWYHITEPDGMSHGYIHFAEKIQL